MKSKSIMLTLFIIFFSWITLAGASPSNKKIGFLIIAPDRGALGNEEVIEIFKHFRKMYTSSLALVGRSYNGMGSEYSSYIQKAITELHAKRVTQIVVIPLFFSKHNPLHEKMEKHLPTYQMSQKVTWAKPMAESYLTAQILLDRIKSVSKNPEQERLVIIGLGAMDEASETAIKKDFSALMNYVSERYSFKEISVGVYYNRKAAKELREKKNKEVDELVIHAAAKKGKALLVPFFLGPKFSHMMSLDYWLGKKFEDFDVSFVKNEILSHPNALLWMKKSANRYLKVTPENVGVLVMPHGATQPYNDSVEATIEPLKKKYPVEIAYGMADEISIEEAIHRLEAKGIRNIVAVRMYSLERQFKNRTNYILGLSKNISKNSRRKIPSQVRTSSVINSFGGYEESPLTAPILLDRIKEISSSPSEETVLILAHGSKTDEDDQAWRDAIKKHIIWIKNNQEVQFKEIHGLTLREDWEDKREEALKQIKDIIKKGNDNGRVLLISDRLYGSGPYKHFLKGLKFELNGKGLANHPNLTKWLESGVEEAIKNKFRQKDENIKLAIKSALNIKNSKSDSIEKSRQKF